MKNIVIVNKAHKLFPEQEEILREKFGTYEFLYVPEEGWTLEAVQRIVESIDLWQDRVIFISPVPYLLATLAYKAGQLCGLVGPSSEDRCGIYIFHNDQREKKELPGGKIISITASTGWVAT